MESLINDLRSKAIPIKVETDPDWTDYATAYNDRLGGDPPDVVVAPENATHICNTVEIAKRMDAKVQARSGGHSYAAFSSCKMTSSCYTFIVVDLRKLRQIRFVDGDASTAVVDGGVRLGELALYIYNHGRRALSHGTCPSVGVGGHLTHGGYGYTSRAWGLALDHIVGMEVVTAGGDLVYVSPTEHRDLFWAFRGAADSFGIVVRFRLKTVPAPRHTLRFCAEYPDIATDYACPGAVMSLQNFACQARFEKEISFGIHLGPGRFGISGVYLNRRDHESTCIPDLLDLPGKPDSLRVQGMGWIDLVQDLAGGSPLETREPFTDSSTFYANSLMVPQGLSHAVFNEYFRFIRINSPAPIQWYAIIDLWGGHDSRISSPSEPSACRRDAFWVVQNFGYVDSGAAFPSSGLEFMKGLHQAMAKSIPEAGACANYPDADMTREQAGTRHHGSSYDRLKGLKQVLDPLDVFHNAQSIGTSGNR